jgi:preprotein translocase subunit SecB
MKSPLQVKNYYFTNISVKANDRPEKTSDKSKRTLNLKTTIETKNDDNDNYVVVLSLSLTPAPDGPGFPYTIEVVAVGHFSVAPAWPADKKEKLVVTSGGGILISAAREQIASLTGRGPHGPFLLPAVDLNTFVREDDQE